MHTRVYAATVSTLNFQARLHNTSGGLVADGTYSIQFKLYNVSGGGVAEWTETQPSVTVKAGYLSVALGSATAFPGTIDWSEEHWLTMNVNGDGEMNPRLKLTAVPYAFRASVADALKTAGGTITPDGLAQLAPAAMQTVNSAVAGVRINQVGSGRLLQLAAAGNDKLTLDASGNLVLAGTISAGGSTVSVGGLTQAGNLLLHDGAGGSSQLLASITGLQIVSGGNIAIGTADTTGTLLVLDNKTDLSDPTGSDGAMYYNSAQGKFRCYQNGSWRDCINGANNNSTASFVSGLANVAGTVNGVAAEMLVFTSATGVSNTAGVTGFTAPAAGSFRTCLVKNNAAITAGTLNLRWRVNGVSVGAAACAMNATTNRQSATALDPGVITFSAGDTIGIAFDSAGMTPAASNDFTAYWTVEYNATNVASNLTTLQSAYAASSSPELVLDATRGALTIRDSTTPIAGSLLEIQDNSGASTYFSVTASGITSANALTVASGGLNLTGGGISNTGSLTGVGANLTASGALTIASAAGGDLAFDSASNKIVIAATDTSLERTAAGSFGLNLVDSADTVFSLSNSGTGTASLNLVDGGLQLAGTVVLTSGGVLQNVTASTAILTSGTLGTARGGTGVDGSGATNGQLLIGNGSGFSLGSLANNGGLTITPGVGTLGLAVNYGATSTSAVRGDTSLTCASGSGNLTGGGTSITLGSGGTCAAISTIANPSFATSVTSPIFTGSSGVTLSSGGSGDLTFDSASNKLVIAATDTTMQRTAAGAYGIDLIDSSTTSLSLSNSGAGVANLNLLDGALQVNGTSVLSNAAALSNLTGISSSGTVALSSLSAGGLVKAAAGTGNLSLAVAGTDYEVPLTFGNGLTRTSNSVALGGTLSAATDLALNTNALTITGSGSSVITALAAGGLQIRNNSTAALSVQTTSGTSYFTVDTSGNLVQVGSSTTDATAILVVLDSYNNATDPGGVNGASYYNSASNKARCYEDGYWTDCVTSGVLGETTLGSANATINVNLAKTYESIECRVEIKGKSAGGIVYARFNNNAIAGTYSWNTYYITGTAVVDAQSASDTEIQLSSTVSSTLPFSGSLKITNFSDTRKSVDWTGVSATTIGTNPQRYSGVGVMDLTSGSISSVQFISSAGTFNAGSHAWCQGRDVR